MTTISTLPTAPSRADPSTFVARSDALLGALDGFVSQTNLVAGEVNTAAATATTQAALAASSGAEQVALATTQAVLATTNGATQVALATAQAVNAATSATAAAGSALVAGAVAWVSGTTYAVGDARYSPINMQTYRRTIAGAGTVDPSLDTTNWTKAIATGGISAVTTATGMTTLTNSPTLLSITPASYGVSVTLPDATTCSVGGPLHIIDNKGAYPVRVCDSTGTLKGFIFAGVVSHVSLTDNSTAAGVWAIENSELVGASAQLLTTNLNQIHVVIDIGSDREVVIGNNVTNSNCYAVAYNRATNTFGSVTLFKTAVSALIRVAACLSGTNQVLVTTCESGAATFEAATLSISGTTITVNTAATATLSANISAFADGCGLIAVGSSFVCSYRVATPAAEIRALSISGTTVTIGAATALDGTTAGLIANATTGVVAASATAGVIYHKYYGVSGTTITAGSGGSFGATSGDVISLAAMASGRWFLAYSQTTANTGNACFISLSGTTTSVINSVVTGTANASVEAFILSASKVYVANGRTSANVNIITDAAGTASIGTAITTGSSNGAIALYKNGNTVYCGGTLSTQHMVFTVDVSTASPVLQDSIVIGNSATSGSLRHIRNSVLSNSANLIAGTDFVQSLDNTLGLLTGVLRGVSFIGIRPGSKYGGYRGKADSERWATDAYSITKTECVV